MASQNSMQPLNVAEEASTETEALAAPANSDGPPRPLQANGSGRSLETRSTHACLLPGLLVCAMAATFFTNLQPVPVCTILAPFCMLVIAEKIVHVRWFMAAVLLLGLSFGASAYGYLYEAAFVIGILLQLVLSVAFVAHRAIIHRHPDRLISLLAFPCVHASIFVLVMYTMPIGSVGNPAYSVTSLPFLVQIAAICGRTGVTFFLDWAAACLAHSFVAGFQHPIARRSLLSCLLVWLLLSLFGALRFYLPHLFLDIQQWDGAVAEDSHQVSCLSALNLHGSHEMYNQTWKRLDAGDTIVIHSERATSSGGDEHAIVEKYMELLQDNYKDHGIEALVVLSFVVEDRCWYYLVSRQGSLMRYAKNHPVPLVENDIVGGDFLPSVVSVPLGRPSGSRNPVSMTGTICFDTDFPWVTRWLSGADLFLETSATWFNIGEEHFQGHKFTAVENGVTLIKCTHNGVTGAFDAFGNVLFRFPQTIGVSTFSVPRLQHVVAFPAGGFVFDAVICVASLFWLTLSAAPAASRRFLSAQ